MLQDELGPLKIIVSELTLTGQEPESGTVLSGITRVEVVQAACDRVRSAWLGAFFSEAGDHTLQRYFNFHLEGITALANTLYLFSQDRITASADNDQLVMISEVLLSLIGHMQQYHGRYFDTQLSAPLSWRQACFQRMSGAVQLLIAKLHVSVTDHLLKDCVNTYIQDILDTGQGGYCSFHALRYFEYFVAELTKGLATTEHTDELLDRLLSGLNFNRLSYLVYRQNQVRQACGKIVQATNQMEFLREKQIELLFVTNQGKLKCHEQYPDLTTMLEGWLGEQMERQVKDNLTASGSPIHDPAGKIAINLSVAQIACIIRLLREENYLSASSLEEIFKLVSIYYSSKMQEQISAGSINKEFYSITQSTALKIEAMLQKMLANLKRNFFPLLAVASVVIGIS
ncbi:hypothetical protein [Mucilaginibacter sp. SP1R1]|uniref:hypothetical protein n=1 Tax=Mucilaginibacter sp. SP1R1 TaxID=2723091 RepID=UPI00160ED8F8|nr:hypothetical protein [Mucilaginibacter sp. SP1R1]MBB6152403.1 hypothetical protein [Mucilaginibacter sp. SP1R1]